MKRKYIVPEIIVMKMDAEEQLLAGSTITPDGGTNTEEQCAPTWRPLINDDTEADDYIN